MDRTQLYEEDGNQLKNAIHPRDYLDMSENLEEQDLNLKNALVACAATINMADALEPGPGETLADAVFRETEQRLESELMPPPVPALKRIKTFGKGSALQDAQELWKASGWNLQPPTGSSAQKSDGAAVGAQAFIPPLPPSESSRKQSSGAGHYRHGAAEPTDLAEFRDLPLDDQVDLAYRRGARLCRVIPNTKSIQFLTSGTTCVVLDNRGHVLVKLKANSLGGVNVHSRTADQWRVVYVEPDA